MRIPDEYDGQWAGKVSWDSGRKRPYPCTINLGATGGTIRYDQSHGKGEGTLTILAEAPLVLTEDYTGPKGGRASWKLALELNALGRLECSWNGGECTATLDRIPKSN